MHRRAARIVVDGSGGYDDVSNTAPAAVVATVVAAVFAAVVAAVRTEDTRDSATVRYSSCSSSRSTSDYYC